jgi:1-phosphatidylinositol-4-phosphate 5-kinase
MYRFSDVSVEFVEFEPYYFRQIRLHDNVQDFDYINSFMKTIKERLTEGGASGAFFFFTKDERFIAKSCTTDEIAHIRRSAVQMEKYLSENPASFITKIYGAYKIQIYGTSFYFFVMNNIFLNPGNEVINEKYDLKGSWVKRNSTPPQIGERVTCTHCNQKYVFTNLKKGSSKKGKKKNTQEEEEMNKCRMQVHHEPNVILKDNDLKYKLRLPNATSKHLITQLHKDTEFLCGLGVMDYSLLVGVHNTEYHVDEEMGKTKPPLAAVEDSPGQRKPQRRKTLTSKQNSLPPSNSKEDLAELLEKAPSSPLNGRMAVSRIVGPEAYYMGIVDFQQQYDFSKKMERFFKVQIQGRSGDGLSCIEPVTYRDRFLGRMEELVDFDTEELAQDVHPQQNRGSVIDEEDEFSQC